MSSTAFLRFAVLIGSLAALLSAASAADWGSCAYDLDRLRRAVRDAADKANDVKSKAEELENCRLFPSTFDYMRDRCRSIAFDYQSAVNSLESELSMVDSRIRSVRLSCGYNFGDLRSPVGAPQQSYRDRLCELYRSYKGKVPLEGLLKICEQSMSEAECKKCLELE